VDQAPELAPESRPYLSDHIRNLLADPKREQEIALLRDNFQDFTPLESDLPHDERLAVCYIQ
jgi:hypothetical protein